MVCTINYLPEYQLSFFLLQNTVYVVKRPDKIIQELLSNQSTWSQQ